MATVKLILQQPYKTPSREEGKSSTTKDGKKRSKPLNPKETRLYVFLIIDRTHFIKIKTEYVIYPKEWDFDIQGKKEILAGSIEFNGALRLLRDEIWNQYKELLKQQPDMSFPQLAEKMKEYGKSKEKPMLDKNKDVQQVLDEYIASLKESVSPLTTKKYTTLKNSLTKFGEVNKKYKNLTFSMIDHAFLDDYRRYLRTQEARGRQKSRPEKMQDGLLLSTQEKYIKSLKVFCKYAEDHGYNKYGTYKGFENITQADQKRKKSDYDIVTLTLAELKQFYDHDFSSLPHLERVRDLFCFGCFTGQRWGDFSNFDKSQLQADIWSFNSEKTKQEMQIDLTGFAAPALDILKKYDYQLPKISQQKFNVALKAAAKEAKINEETKIIRYVGTQQINIIKPKFQFLGSHSARRTCVSILLNDFNMNVVHVMGITGHTDIKTLQKYIHKDRSARREAISKTRSISEIMNVVVSEASA